MKVLGINASPRSGGNSQLLLERALEGAASAGAEVSTLVLSSLKISPVREEEYENISGSGLSVVEDGMSTVFKGIMKADVIIIASPIFFGSITAQAKAMIDRFQCVWLSKKVFGMEIFKSRKKGAFICVEATDRQDFFDNAKFIVRHFFATINAKYAAELLAAGLDKKGKVLERPELLEKAFELGKSLVK